MVTATFLLHGPSSHFELVATVTYVLRDYSLFPQPAKILTFMLRFSLVYVHLDLHVPTLVILVFDMNQYAKQGIVPDLHISRLS